jgi:class 3 adenylate cyclase/tetratricopeptide (TPR) repeat protein
VQDTLTPADLDHLRTYLPSHLIETLRFDLSAPAPTLLKECIDHLSQLLGMIYTHLPPYLVEWVIQDPTPGRVGCQFMHGTLLFADISGFTAMSERLSRIGREGAEEINSIVNRYFSTMLAILREHHGQLFEFGGDALLGIFLEPDSATRAVQAARRMQEAMGAFSSTATSQGEFEVQMKVGIHRGHFLAAQLGTPRGMKAGLLGSVVSDTAATESAAEAGQILVDPTTLAAVSVPCRARSAPTAPYQIVEEIEPATMLPQFPAPQRPHFPEPSLENLRRAVELLDGLAPYLQAGLLPRLASDPHTASVQGEHRLVSVLFANVHGLGEIADQLGPGREEEIIAALNRYFVAMEGAIHRFGGVVNTIDLNAHGDKLFASFGAPQAHEDDAERAVRAALAMQERMSELRSLPAEVGLDNLQLRQQIGISFGYVFAGFVGTNWRRDYTVMGDDVNLSARLMAKAEPGSVIVSSDVRRKVQALFELTSRGKVPLKGKSQPVPISSVEGIRPVPEPLRGVKGMRSPLVGRQAEWDQLMATLEELARGRGQIVSVIGEAGLGKSRLIAEMRQARRSVRWIEGRCLSYTESVSFWPFQQLVGKMVGLRPDDSERVAWNRLIDALEKHLDAEEMRASLPYLGHFLNLPLEADLQEQIRYLDAEALQRRVYVAIGGLIESIARSEAIPLVLALDDLHWMDQASQGLLEHLMPLVNQVPLLLLLIYRPERAKACWQVREKAAREFPHCTSEIALQPLPAADGQRLLSNLVGIEDWPPQIYSMLLERAEGNPLYLEEVLRALIDDDVLVQEDGRWRISGDVSAIRVPDTLQGVLMTRLDRLEEGSRWTAQVASVIGRVFTLDVLDQIHDIGGDQLNQHLVALQRYEIVHETQRIPELIYSFKHGMMQEVCYRSMLTRSRRLYHRKIARYLAKKQSADHLESESHDALIAHHAFAGQDWARALRYQFLAGRQAKKLFANHEAIDHFRRALKSAESIGVDATAAQRLTIYMELGELLTLTSQYDAARDHLDKAFSLATARGNRDAQAHICRWLARMHERLGEYPDALKQVEKGLDILDREETAEAAELRLIAGLIHTRQGDYDKALNECQEGLRIAHALDEVTALARAYTLLGVINRQLGMSVLAIEYFEQAFALYERADDLQGQAISHNQMANAYFDLAQWEEAKQHYHRARGTFDRIGNVYHRAFADNNLGGIARNQGRLDEALSFYRAGLETLERSGGSAYVLGVFHMNLGATLARRGEINAAVQHLQRSETLFEESQAQNFLPELHRHFATVALIAGEPDKAKRHIQQALQLARKLTMRAEEGAALRVLGEVNTAQGAFDAAAEQLLQSVAVLEEVGDEYERARSQLSLAQSYVSKGEPQAGLEHLEACIATFDRLGAEMDLETARALKEHPAQEGDQPVSGSRSD